MAYIQVHCGQLLEVISPEVHVHVIKEANKAVKSATNGGKSKLRGSHATISLHAQYTKHGKSGSC